MPAPITAGSLWQRIQKGLLGTVGGWNPDVPQAGVRPGYGLSTTDAVEPVREGGGFAPGEADLGDVRNTLGDILLAAAMPNIGSAPARAASPPRGRPSGSRPVQPKLAVPATSAQPAIADEVTLYSGGGGNFWSSEPGRAASFGPVRKVTVPRNVFESGRVEASKLGQPTKWDTVLPAEWVNKAVDAPEIKPTVYKAEGMLPSDVDALLSQLGVKRF